MAAEVWQGIGKDLLPADRWLARLFFSETSQKKVGSRDRKFLSETIYALFSPQKFSGSMGREDQTAAAHE